MDSPWLWNVFELADSLGESDPRKLLDLPADLLLHWQAYRGLKQDAIRESVPPVDAVPSYPAAECDPDDFSQCLRVIGYG